MDRLLPSPLSSFLDFPVVLVVQLLRLQMDLKTVPAPRLPSQVVVRLVPLKTVSLGPRVKQKVSLVLLT